MNGTGYEIADDFPFVLSLSKHANYFFNSLLYPDKQIKPDEVATGLLLGLDKSDFFLAPFTSDKVP